MRKSISAVLIVLACLLTPLGALSTWAKLQIGDSDRYVAAMAPLADNPDVRRAIADAVSREITKQLELGPLQGALQSFTAEAVRSFTGTDTFQAAWDSANRAAHDAVQDALNRGDDGSVTIDIAPITEQVKEQLVADGVPFAERIPVQHTEVTVMNAQDLGNLRQGFHWLQVAGLWLPLAALVCAAAGIALAARRLRAVTVTALGMALGAALLGAGLSITRSLTLDDLPPDVPRAAVAAVYDALTASLRTGMWTILWAGLAVGLGTWLYGRFRGRAAEAGK